MRTGCHLLRRESGAGLRARIGSKDEERLVVRSRPPVLLIVPDALFLLRRRGLYVVAAVAEERRGGEHSRVDLGLLTESRGGVVPSAFCLELRKIVHRAVNIIAYVPQTRAVILVHVSSFGATESVEADDGVIYGVGDAVPCLRIRYPALVHRTRQIHGEDKRLVVLHVVGGSPGIILAVPFDDVVPIRPNRVVKPVVCPTIDGA